MEKIITSMLSILFITGCANTYKPVNESISQIDEGGGYRVLTPDLSMPVGENIILLAFSGGGTRAAALSYGVMQELRDTTIEVKGSQVRLLDEIDSISSVSGGSFTAAYFGVFGEQLFETYERDVLRQSIQSSLLKRLLSPGHWMKSLFSAFDRTEMTVDYYDRMIFKGATFADIPLDQRPYIEINATDLATGLRFPFVQERFDLLCSDLNQFSIARAVTASSAVPVAFPSVVIENHADHCEISQSQEWKLLEKVDTRNSLHQQQLVEGLKSYRDIEHRKYIHLVDGGISDNLGLRGLIERLDILGGKATSRFIQSPPRNIMIILVNAEVNPEKIIEKTASKPSVEATISAFTNAQVVRYNIETRDKLRRKLEKIQRIAEDHNLPTQIFFTEVSFDSIPKKETSRFFNNLPTSLELDDDVIDALIKTGRALMRDEPEFKRFLLRNNGKTL